MKTIPLISDYRLALLLHPDSSHPSSSPANFATLNRAYKLLSTPSSREDYLRSNFGWSHDGKASPYEFDPMMAEILRRKRDGAGRRFRTEAGRGAWGTYGPDGKWQPAQEYRGGAGEPKYMSHSSFGSMLIFLVRAGSWVSSNVLSATSDHPGLESQAWTR
jgi:curved DNA-binding protein CbpA